MHLLDPGPGLSEYRRPLRSSMPGAPLSVGTARVAISGL